MAKGVSVLDKLRAARNSKPVAHILTEEDTEGPFWEALGGTPDEVPEADDDDAAASAAAVSDVSLHKVSDESGELQVEEIARDSEGHFTRDMLDTKDVFVLDTGAAIYVWVGKGASKEERRNAMSTGAVRPSLPYLPYPCWAAVAHAPTTRYCVTPHHTTQAFIEKNGRPSFTSVFRVNESGEPADFREHFYKFTPPRSLDNTKPAKVR